MIHSATDLLNETANFNIKPALVFGDPNILPRASQLSAYSHKQRKDFALHFLCIQGWFTRCSWKEKVNTLTQLLKELRTIDSLSLILNTLLSTCSKTTAYAKCQYTTNFVYDKTLRDHNRSLHNKTFKQTQAEDVSWFSSLQEDHEQVLIIIGLIRLGGGCVMHHIFEEGKKLYNQRLEKLEAKRVRYSIVEIKTPTPEHVRSDYNVRMQLGSKPVHRHKVAPRTLSIKPTSTTELPKQDPRDPFVIKVEQLRKSWNDKIRKYRIQVEGKPPKKAGKKGKASSKSSKSKKGTSSKSSKSKKEKASSKSAKSSKSGKSSKGKKKKGKGQEQLDYIQLLPIWIVKKIFNYLDVKTLRKVKSVNKYWTYAISDMQKDQKARKFLDKFIKKRETAATSAKIQANFTERPLLVKPLPKSHTPQKRLRKLWERGAVIPKLKINMKQLVFTHTLVIESAMQAPQNYMLPIHQLCSFPRNFVKGAPPLHKERSCIANELGFIKITHEIPTIVDSLDMFPSEFSVVESKTDRSSSKSDRSSSKTDRSSSKTDRTSSKSASKSSGSGSTGTTKSDSSGNQ